jgi:maltooligosyltrehalose trehalohydrolase
VLQRHGDGRVALCLMNFSKVPVSITVPVVDSAWELLLDSAAPEWGGSSQAPSAALTGDTVEIQPESFILYTSDHV